MFNNKELVNNIDQYSYSAAKYLESQELIDELDRLQEEHEKWLKHSTRAFLAIMGSLIFAICGIIFAFSTTG